MGKSFIINDRQLQTIVESQLNESEYVIYNITPDDMKYRDYRTYFNNLKGPIDGRIDSRTKKIIFRSSPSQQFEFDFDKVKFEPDGKSASVLNKDLTAKYGTPGEKEQLKSKPVRTPISSTKLTQDNIYKTYKDAVHRALQLIYSEKSQSDRGSKFWDAESGRGPSGRGGVVNFNTVGDIVKDALGIENTEGGNWSILNYFDTQPRIREIVIDEYKKRNNLSNIDDLKKFENWIIDNRHMLFDEKLGDAETLLDKFLKINIESYLNGVKNEKKAFDYVENMISGNPKLSMSTINLPGSPKDRAGVDFSIFMDGKEYKKFQAKPFDRIQKIEKGGKIIYRVYSYNVSRLDKIIVNYFIFASHDKNNGVVVFDNVKGEYEIVPTKGSFAYIDFTYPPKSYDPNFK